MESDSEEEKAPLTFPHLPAHVIEFGIPVELEAVLAYPVEEFEDLHARHRLAPDDVAYRRGLGHAQHEAVGEVTRGGGGG